jgi:hypothetical protein
MGNNIGMGHLGQFGSAYTDVTNIIVPPKDMVIVAINFLVAQTPTLLTPEISDRSGPGCIAISGSTTDLVDAAGNNYFNFNGVWASEIPNENVTAGTDITLDTPADPVGRIAVGQYVLLVNGAAREDGDTAMAIDSETPTPIYTGPNARGVKVTEYDNISKVQLSADITPTGDQALVFIDEQHGVGGITAASQAYAEDSWIYGRWTAFQAQDTKGAICYFGY